MKNDECQDLEIVNSLKNRLQEKVKLHQVIMFASKARGDAESDSDMDVLIVLNEPVSRQSRKIVSDNAWEIWFDAGIVVVPIVVSRDNWEHEADRVSLLEMAVREEGMEI
ncbi:MAG: nucleotidyltransferase domain-containing protein [Desulfosalsimonadaceae bacterium]